MLIQTYMGKMGFLLQGSGVFLDRNITWRMEPTVPVVTPFARRFARQTTRQSLGFASGRSQRLIRTLCIRSSFYTAQKCCKIRKMKKLSLLSTLLTIGSIASLMVCLDAVTLPAQSSTSNHPDPYTAFEIEELDFISQYQIPTSEETADLFFWLSRLKDSEQNPEVFNQRMFDRTFENFWGTSSVVSTFTMSYFRQASITRPRSFLQQRINDNPTLLGSPIIQRILLTDCLVESGTNESDLRRLVTPEGYVDEGINMVWISPVRPFVDELVVFLFENPWLVFTPKNQFEASDFLGLFTGGGTNSMTVSFFRKPIDSSQTYETVLGNWLSHLNRNNQRLEVFRQAGVLDSMNASRVSQILSVGFDPLGNLQAHVVDVIESTETGWVYEVVYFMNISRINMNYPIVNELLLQMAQLSALIYIELENEPDA